MNCEYVQNMYGVPACIGRRICFKGRHGTIAEDRGHYIGVNFDDDKPGSVFNLHPTWKVEYGEMGTVRKPSRSQQRYKNFISSEYPGTFGEWLGIKKKVAS